MILILKILLLHLEVLSQSTQNTLSSIYSTYSQILYKLTHNYPLKPALPSTTQLPSKK